MTNQKAEDQINRKTSNAVDRKVDFPLFRGTIV